MAPWAADNADGKLVEFRICLPGVPTGRRVPKATGYEPDLLALSHPQVEGMEQQAIETKLMQAVDTDAARVRVDLLARGTTNLTVDDRCDWVRYLNSLRMRQPKFVSDVAKSAGTETIREELARDVDEYTALAQSDDPPTLVEWVRQNRPGLIEDFGLTLYPKVINDPVIGEKLINLNWIVCDLSSAKHELILADNPLVSVGNLDSPTLILALPLSPTKLFVACRATETSQRFRTEEPNAIVARMNESSVERANRWVYARTEAPARFIRKRVILLGKVRTRA
jgi:Protein of unknown function (DUF4238)